MARDGLRRADSVVPRLCPGAPHLRPALRKSANTPRGRGLRDPSVTRRTARKRRAGGRRTAGRTPVLARHRRPVRTRGRVPASACVCSISPSDQGGWRSRRSPWRLSRWGSECLRAEKVRRDTREPQETFTQWQVPATNSRVRAPAWCDFSFRSRVKGALSAVLTPSGHAHRTNRASSTRCFPPLRTAVSTRRRSRARACRLDLRGSGRGSSPFTGLSKPF